MRFTTREDIEAPVETVFAAVSDFAAAERQAMRRGAEVQRTGEHGRIGPGTGWVVQFRHRGRRRDLVTEIVRFDPPRALATTGHVGGLHADVTVELTLLSPRSTRLKVDVELKPRSFGARLFLQSLRLAKSRLTNRFKERVHTFARGIEDRSA
jgi:uncharacterized protein YndB with AHSA1/START domain